MSLAGDICLALYQDISANAELGTVKNVQLLRRPLIVLPEDCPLLCIWLINKTMVPSGTVQVHSSGERIGGIRSRYLIGVSWQEPAVDQIETLKVSLDRSEKILAQIEKIERRVRRLAVVGLQKDGADVGGADASAYEIVPVSTDYVPPPELATGMVDGFMTTAAVDVDERV